MTPPEGNKYVYEGGYNDGNLIQWYGFIDLPYGTKIRITVEIIKEEKQ